jgi:PAS domain S-box-containing protein
MPKNEVPSGEHWPATRGYPLAVSSVTVALGPALLLQHYGFHDVEYPLFLFAIAVTAWYAGMGPALVSIVSASIAFDFFFTEPLYSLYFSPSEIPSIFVFVLFAGLITWFSSIRRRVETELRAARDQLQEEVKERTRQASLLNLTHDSIFVRDMNNVITYWNRGAEELYGWTPAEAQGRKSHELLRTVFPQPLQEINAQLLRDGRWEGEVRRIRHDDTGVIASSRWSLRRDEQGNPAAIMETNNDITARKKWEESIGRLNEELARRSSEVQAANKELEAFAYSVSHDLRAPLRHMVGFAELLQKRASAQLDERGTRYMKLILESAKRMGDLIDDLLAFSRMGRMETQKTLVNLDQLVEEAISEIRAETAGRDVAWHVVPLPVCYGDRAMLRLVFVNLISNAVKFTRERQRAEIEIGCVEGQDDEAVIFVKDNGAGFDMQYVGKLFGVFQRLHQPDEFEGTGIGLATVQRIIHRHGGEVRAEGAVGQGATFYFSVPKS